MKCPHCGYSSFEFLDECKSCAKDLKAHKRAFGFDFLEPLPVLTAGGGVARGAVASVVSAAAGAAASGGGFGTDDFGFTADNSSQTDTFSSMGTEEMGVNFGGDDGSIGIEIGGDDDNIDFGGSGDSNFGLGDDISFGDDSNFGGEPPEESDSGFSLDFGDDFGGGNDSAPAAPEPADEISLDIEDEAPADEISLDDDFAIEDDGPSFGEASEPALDVSFADEDDDSGFDSGSDDFDLSIDSNSGKDDDFESTNLDLDDLGLDLSDDLDLDL